MRCHEEPEHYLSQPNISNQHLIAITQLLQMTMDMSHIDELFLWLANTMVQRFGVLATQFWVRQINRESQFSLALRTMICQDSSLPLHILKNNRVSAVAEHIMGKWPHSLSLSIDTLFSSYQADLLKRYGLNHCCNCCLSSDALLVPTHKDLATGKIATPLMMVVLLFFRQPPSQKLLLAVEQVLAQALLIAKNRGLLQAPSSGAKSAEPKIPFKSSRPQAFSFLSELIPRHIENVGLMRHSNPLAHSLVITDRQARRLYRAIDGYKNVNELVACIPFDREEIYQALWLLYTQHRIQLYEPGGQPVNASLFLSKH